MTVVVGHGPALASADPGDAAAPAGRTRVTPRALTRVVAAVAGTSLRVDADQVRVDLEDHAGRLGVTVRSAIGIPALADLDEDSPAETLLERCARTRGALHDRVEQLTGYRVSRVTVHLTGAVVVHERRVA